MTTPFDNAKWTVEEAAGVQAIHDAKTSSDAQISEYLSDTGYYATLAGDVLASWAKTDAARRIWSRTPKALYDKLTDKEKELLIYHWADSYIQIFFRQIRLRGSNGSSD